MDIRVGSIAPFGTTFLGQLPRPGEISLYDHWIRGTGSRLGGRNSAAATVDGSEIRRSPVDVVIFFIRISCSQQ